ncbi:MAG: DUF6521 family protein [Bacteroidia bacterium]|jgi:hypothetical protein|nr:DUF6521 family protein [Bacteroidia bacterium]
MNEFYTMQNYALGASALYAFTSSYYKVKSKQEGPILPYSMAVLPIVFNEDCVNEIAKVERVTKSRFLTTLSDNRDIPVGLQQRMIAMSPQTFKSLNIAFCTALLSYNQETAQLIPSNKSNAIPKFRFSDNQKIIKSSETLGKWFAQYPIEELCISLNIIF